MSWKIILEQMTDNVIISQVVAVMYVILNKAENHMTYGELVGITETRCSVPQNA
jgi:hypothetical protein